MAARLGNVLFVAFVLIGLGLAYLAGMAYNDAPAHNKTIVAWMFGLPAAISFLIGWACRYVLTGR